MTLTAQVISDDAHLQTLVAEWDQLAVERARPFSAPAWMLSWSRHLCPVGEELLIVTVSEEERLVGIAPFAAMGRTWLSPGGSLAPIEPLVAEGRQREFAAAVAEALAAAEDGPRDLRLERQGDSPAWGDLLAGAWPGRRSPWLWTASTVPVPCIEFGAGFEAWLGEKSGSFRRDLKRSEKRLIKDGGEFRTTTAETLEADVADFIRLHRGRLAERGGSSLDDDRIETMLVAVGNELLGADRFRLLCLELGGTTIAAQLLICAGSEVSAWNSGFDEEFSRYSPIMQCIVQGLRGAAEKGGATMSLGPGDQAYKQRLATRKESVEKLVLMPRGSGYAMTRARLAPLQARRAISTRLSDSAKSRIQDFLGR